MEENTQYFWCICFTISKMVKMHLKLKKICTVYGEGAVTCMWFAKSLGTIYILAK